MSGQLVDKVRASCPSCGARMKVKPAVLKKKVTCPKCKEEGIVLLKIEDGAAAIKPNEKILKRCGCGAEVEDDAVICVHCGTNLMTGEKIGGSSAPVEERETTSDSQSKKFGPFKKNIPNALMLSAVCAVILGYVYAKLFSIPGVGAIFGSVYLFKIFLMAGIIGFTINKVFPFAGWIPGVIGVGFVALSICFGNFMFLYSDVDDQIEEVKKEMRAEDAVKSSKLGIEVTTIVVDEDKVADIKKNGIGDMDLNTASDDLLRQECFSSAVFNSIWFTFINISSIVAFVAVYKLGATSFS